MRMEELNKVMGLLSNHEGKNTPRTAEESWRGFLL